MSPRIRKSAVPNSFPSFTPSCNRAQCPYLDVCSRRSFSQSSHVELRRQTAAIDMRRTKLRRDMYAWLHGPGAVFRDPLPGSSNYLNAYDKAGRLLRAPKNSDKTGGRGQAGREGDKDSRSEEELQEMIEEGRNADGTMNTKGETPLPPESLEDLRPFPLNRDFRSEAVLSEELRNEIFRRVTEEGQNVRVVSAGLGVTMERVAAVVRLKTIEQDWVKQGKRLAIPYQRAILSMLPTTPFNPNFPRLTPHESINDLPVHQDTLPQIFHPVSESRAFTREDAAAVFSPTLLPPDVRIPHPELVVIEKEILAGVPEAERIGNHKKRLELEAEEKKRKEQERRAREERETKVVQGRRWDFRFKEISVEDVGPDGRGRAGVGWRYGVPHNDRKKGQIKIPRSVA